MWSVGVLFYAMLNGSFPKDIASRNPSKIRNALSVLMKLKEIFKSEQFTPFSQLSSNPKVLEMQTFIELCLVVKSENRLTADELLRSIPSHLTDLVTQGLVELTI
jgi:serine/threonine protein kinase